MATWSEFVGKLLMQASERSQVVVTTHSPQFMDLVDAEDVRVVQRVDGATTVGRMAERQRNAVRKGLLSLGELMVTEGLQQELDLSGEE